MSTKQKGFSILEIILLVAVVGLIGAVAWLFVNNAQKGTTNSATTPTSPSPSASAKKSPAPWYTYTPAGKQYSLQVADGWTLHKKAGGDTSLYSTGSLALQSGTTGQVVSTAADIDLCGGLILDYSSYANTQQGSGTLTTNSGLTVTTSTAKDELGVSGGGTTYSYNATKNNQTVHISYSTCKDGPDYHDVVEQVVKTLAIN